jgi:GNAT superfamily N-acetyltransferase
VFNDLQKGQYYVVEDNDKVIGSMLTTYEWSDWRNQYIYWLQSVYLIPEYRGKHIFSKMFEHLKRKVIGDNQVAGIRLYVDERNQHALSVYKSLGMFGDHYRTFEWMKDAER